MNDQFISVATPCNMVVLRTSIASIATIATYKADDDHYSYVRSSEPLSYCVMLQSMHDAI